MSSNEERAEDIQSTLIYIQEQVRMLKEEREKLLEANQELVSLALEMEKLLEKSGAVNAEELDLDRHGYSSDSSWRSDPQSHDSPDELKQNAQEDIEKIQRQISTIRGMVKNLENFKANNNSR